MDVDDIIFNLPEGYRLKNCMSCGNRACCSKDKEPKPCYAYMEDVLIMSNENKNKFDLKVNKGKGVFITETNSDNEIINRAYITVDFINEILKQIKPKKEPKVVNEICKDCQLRCQWRKPKIHE